MYFIMGIILIPLAIILLGVITFLTPNVKHFTTQFFIPFNSIREDYDAILKKQSRYYNLLSFPEQDEFIKRVYFFLRGKKIHGADGITVTGDQKLAIAAVAVQLTFGLERNRFPDFNEIIIHPDAYNCTIDHLSHRGDTDEQGHINLSWKYFTEGNAVADDGVNLGLHEMAHALELEKVVIGTSFKGSFAGAYSNWEKIAAKEMLAMRATHKGFIRHYAAANLNEFFACCMEVFFEQPDAMKENLPDLYEKTCLMLRQDPARKVFRL